MKAEQQLKVLDAYWHGIREILRAAFDNPTDYVIQKGAGVIALHAVFPQIVEIVRSRGLSTTEPTSYKNILAEPLIKLQGDDSEGHPVSGIDFWARAPKGAAGSYSSSTGRRVLAAKLRQLLPPVEIEEEDAMSKKRDIHVVPHGESWATKRKARSG